MNPVTRPRHYQFEGEIHEVRDVIRERTGVYLDNDFPAEGLYDYNNIIKYVLRGPAKNGIEDFKKAQYCLASLIDLLEADTENSGEYGYGSFGIDAKEGDGYPSEPERDCDEDEMSGFLDPDVLADVLTKMKESMRDKEDEMRFRILTNKYFRSLTDDRLTGLRYPKFNE